MNFWQKYGRWTIVLWMAFSLLITILSSVEAVRLIQRVDLQYWVQHYLYSAILLSVFVPLFNRQPRFVYFFGWYAVLAIIHFFTVNFDWYYTSWVYYLNELLLILATIWAFTAIRKMDLGVFNLRKNVSGFDRTLKAMNWFIWVGMILLAGVLTLMANLETISWRESLLLDGGIFLVLLIIRFFAYRRMLTVLLFTLMGAALILRTTAYLHKTVEFIFADSAAYYYLTVIVWVVRTIPITLLAWLFLRTLRIHKEERTRLVDNVS